MVEQERRWRLDPVEFTSPTLVVCHFLHILFPPRYANVVTSSAQPERGQEMPSTLGHKTGGSARRRVPPGCLSARLPPGVTGPP